MDAVVLLPIQGGSSQFFTITYDVIGGFHQCLYGEYVINLIILLCSKHNNISIYNIKILIKYSPPPRKVPQDMVGFQESEGTLETSP